MAVISYMITIFGECPVYLPVSGFLTQILHFSSRYWVRYDSMLYHNWSSQLYGKTWRETDRHSGKQTGRQTHRTYLTIVNVMKAIVSCQRYNMEHIFITGTSN